ncbi:MAG: AAC(3) family N-acetyltransferase [Negativicutes bacterium]|jgi:aminoglycoside 3-N-acetyltransferase
MVQERIYSRNDISDALKSSGIANYEIVLAHCSLKSFGQVDGGAASVVEALTMMSNTVLFPAFTGKITDGKNCPPVMNVAQSPTWTGAIPEAARIKTGALRSLHPTHSLTGFGARAKALLVNHENTHSPCDENSPFYSLVRNNGIIALFGCDHNSNTMVHCCEELAKVPYHLQHDVTDGVVMTDSREIIVANRLHNWQKPPTNFNKIEQLLVKAQALIVVKVCNSQVKIIDARKMFDVVCNQLIRDPGYLII